MRKKEKNNKREKSDAGAQSGAGEGANKKQILIRLSSGNTYQFHFFLEGLSHPSRYFNYTYFITDNISIINISMISIIHL